MFDFTTKITKALTLKAKWTEKSVEPEYSSFVNVTKEDNVYSFADGTYQFIEENGYSKKTIDAYIREVKKILFNGYSVNDLLGALYGLICEYE